MKKKDGETLIKMRLEAIIRAQEDKQRALQPFSRHNPLILMSNSAFNKSYYG